VCHNDLAESEADLLNVESSEQAFVKPSSHTAWKADDPVIAGASNIHLNAGDDWMPQLRGA
jgi:hypothetical protein